MLFTLCLHRDQPVKTELLKGIYIFQILETLSNSMEMLLYNELIIRLNTMLSADTLWMQMSLEFSNLLQ